METALHFAAICKTITERIVTALFKSWKTHKLKAFNLLLPQKLCLRAVSYFRYQVIILSSSNMYSRQSSCNLVNCSSSCLFYFMFVYTLVILTELLLHKYTLFIFHNYYLQPFAGWRVNSYKHSACLSSESSPVWFILVSDSLMWFMW